MPEIVACPSCRRRLHLPHEYLGREVRCPSCDRSFVPTVQTEASLPDGRRSAITSAAPSPNRLAGERPEPRLRPGSERLGPSRQLSSRGMWLGIVGILGCVAIIVAVVMNLSNRKAEDNARREKQEEAERADAARRQAEISAFRAQPPLTSDEIKKEIGPIFDRLGAAFREHDAGAAMSFFHIERMMEELEAQPEFPAGAFGSRTTAWSRFRRGFGDSLVKNGMLTWRSSEIKDVTKLEGNEAVVIVRHTDDDGDIHRLRWWVTKRSGEWQVYDFEDLSVGFQISTLVGSLFASSSREMQGLLRGQNDLNEAIRAVVQADGDAANRHLQRILHLKLPRKFEAVRSVVTGMLHFFHEEHQEALAAFDRANELCADMPILDLLRAQVFDKLGDWRQCLFHADRFRKRLGDDGIVSHVRGDALYALGKNAEAAAAYRTSLDFNPKDAEVFFTLVVRLPKGDRGDDLPARYAKVEKARELFEDWAEQFREQRDSESLGKMAEAMQKLEPQNASPPYYLCLARAWEGRAEPALEALRRAVKLQKDEGRHREYTDGFLQAAVHGGITLEAYAAASNAREAFQVLARRLKEDMLNDDMPGLLAAHAKRDPDDPLLPFHRGELLVRQGRYALADKEFAAAMARKPDDFTAGHFRDSRVTASYHTGQSLTALAEIGPRDATFKQLSDLCLSRADLKTLEALIDAQTKVDAKSRDLLWCRVVWNARQKKPAEAVAVFREMVAKEADEEKEGRVHRFLHEMRSAGFLIEGYQGAPDARKAFQVLMASLQDADEWKDARRLHEAHRKQQPDDPRLLYWTGEFAVQDKNWDKAIVAFKEWMEKQPEDEQSYRWRYVYAMYMAGKGMKAYAELEDAGPGGPGGPGGPFPGPPGPFRGGGGAGGVPPPGLGMAGGAPVPGAGPGAAPPLPEIDPRQEVFTQLANLMIGDRKWDDLQRLVAAHRENVPNDPESFWYETRVRLGLKKTTEAMALLQKACEKQKEELRRNVYIRQCAHEMCELGQGMEAYRAAPDKPVAFNTLAGSFLFKKQDRELQALLAEHGKKHADDPWHLHYSAELHLLRGEFNRAEELLTTALAKATTLETFIRSTLDRVRIKTGKVVVAYQELGANRRSFDTLANLCLNEKNAAQLEALLAAHQKAHPNSPPPPAWQVHLRWLKEDYEGTLKLLNDMPPDDESPFSRFQWRFDDYRVRALVKLKRFPEAIREADAQVKKGHDRTLLVLAHAANGDVKQAIAVVEQAGENVYLLTTCYSDADLGPILKSDAFRAFREKFPEPKVERGFDD